MAEINLIPKMTSNTSPSGIVSASHEQDPAWRAFDHSTTEGSRPFWYASATPPTGGHWIQYQFEEYAAINKIALQTGLVSGGMFGVKDFRFLGSEDGVYFTELYSGTHQNNANRTEYTFNNTRSYLYYRLQGNSYHGTSVLITELEMFGEFKPPSFNKILLLSEDDKVKTISQDGAVIEIPSQTEQDFIDYGMSFSDLNSINFKGRFNKKTYISIQSNQLGNGKVFEQALDAGKVVKNVKIQ